MQRQIVMPKLSDSMEEGTLLQWLVKVGDLVSAGQAVAELETDKAVIELEVTCAGEVVELAIAEGATVAVGGALLSLQTTEIEASVQSMQATASAGSAHVRERGDGERDSTSSRVAEKNRVETTHGRPSGVIASPAARRLARELEVDLQSVSGSGPGGRIILADVEQVAGQVLPRESAGLEHDLVEENLKKAVKVRRIMARKMVDAWGTIPHFYVTFSVDMTDVIRFRKDLRVTINDFILAATAKALQEHPWVNSWWVDGEAVEQPQVHLAMAVATDRGLYNPVIHNCAELDLRQISDRAIDLANAAQLGKLQPADLEGGTFSISNMGMLGVESFRAIITPPQAAVLAVGTVRGEVVVDESGEPAVAPIARLTLAADHRILDGADAAEFMATLKSYLEAPVTLIG